jgi:hypothetical protein
VYIRKVEKVNGKLQNVEFDKRCFEHEVRRWRRSQSRSGIRPRLRFAARSDAYAVSDPVMCGGKRRLLKLVRSRNLKRHSTRSFSKPRSNG